MSFKDKRLAIVREGRAPKGFPAILTTRTQALLEALERAIDLEDLRSPPGNRLEQLHGGRKGQHSLRVNAQWRLCFRWTEEGAENVEFVDYH